MISIDLTGNISDQLFRYAICRSVAERNSYTWGINPTPSHDYYNGREQMYFFEDINYGLPINTTYGQLPEGVTNIWEEKRNHFQTHDFYPYQSDIFDIPDNTKLIIYCGQNAMYLNKSKVKKWLTIKEEYIQNSQQALSKHNIELDDNLCVLNCRGGEYIGIPSLFLQREYWINAIHYMLDINPDMRFIIVTEDFEYYKRVFNLPVYHFNIHIDYYIINNAKNLILSNSGFGLFPTYTSKNVENVIAPKHWARHNLGIWANSDVKTFADKNWAWLDREGKLRETKNL